MLFSAMIKISNFVPVVLPMTNARFLTTAMQEGFNRITFSAI